MYATTTPIPPQTMRLMILLILIGMELLAAFYLRRRRMPILSYLGWGLLALLLPAVGPFLVILSHPGRSRWRSGKI
jgi:hypothetical protein